MHLERLYVGLFWGFFCVRTFNLSRFTTSLLIACTRYSNTIICFCECLANILVEGINMHKLMLCWQW